MSARPRLAINGSFLGVAETGVQRYAHEMCRALHRSPVRAFETVLIAPGRAADVAHAEPPLADHIVVDPGDLPVAPWVQIALPLLMRGQGAECLWSPTAVGPIAVARQVVTFHDAAVFVAEPRWFTRGFRAYYRFLMRRLGRRVCRVVTSSDFSRTELVRYGVVEPKRIEIIACGVSASFRPTPRAAHPQSLANYVLCFGGGNPRKNEVTAISAWQLLPAALRAAHPLVIVGANPGIYGAQALGAAEDKHLVRLNYVAEPELAALVSGARAILYPSYYEGFGLPPLEALACGTPAVVSNAASLPEVLVDAALYADPSDARAFAMQLTRLLCEPELRAQLVARGQALVERYSWSTAARTLATLLNGLVTPREPAPNIPVRRGEEPGKDRSK